MPSKAVEERARKKMTDDADRLLMDSYSGYSSVKVKQRNLQLRDSQSDYGLLPVWKYLYTYQGNQYPFYMNGQTGKIVGNPPISMKKLWAYTGTIWACMWAIIMLLRVFVM